VPRVVCGPNCALERTAGSYSLATVFLDENAVRFFDPDHSQDENRFIMLGMSFKLRVLVVCHCYRKNDTVIRIISARKADKHEAGDYWR
jgi:uncharacterized protein